ncbi:serine hydrolase domain-containing protein [Sphingomonas pruni]|uniref:serine hydrolase domain-containing protein n=1 Tax=Sphingomonas pruni TaxID=40683 RepID=UPI000A06917A|nr:serine hydrolase domain-containing protein [Sphingomonas pruni]
MTERDAANRQSALLLQNQEPRIAKYLTALGSCFRRGTFVLAAAACALILTGQAVPAATSTPAPARQLVVATAAQDTRFAPAFAEVDAWVAKKAFPGAVLAVGQHGRLLALKAFGRIDSAPDAPPMPVDAIFDLASLTKVIGTTTAAEILYDRGRLELDVPVTRYLPEFGETPGHENITVRNLLSHSSGLQSADGVWRHAKDRQDLLRQLYATPALTPPGTAYAYRDTNIILLGEIVRRLSGQPLDRFLGREVFAPLGMRDTGFRPSRALLPRIAPTEQDDNFRHMLVRGVVHDENAYVMGGVAGHAGLFSTARDLSALAQLYLNHGSYRGKRLIKASTIALFETRQNLPPGSSRALGWDMPTPGGFAGPLASPHAIIHTGFTGTSIYIDPDRDAFIILLTNRVNPTRNNMLIAQARPAIHSAVLSILDGAAQKK